jgi:preprotein translocase subunit SecB
MENLKSVLIFEKYVVNKVEFIRNENYNAEEKTKIQFAIKKQAKKNDNKMEITLCTTVFENAKDNNYPFEMNVEITGFFAIESEDKEINLEPNAVAILYPYIRAIVSTYTANANVNALILPPINVNNLFKEN